MAVNKVVVNNETIIDLTSDTVDASFLEEGVTAHDKAGNVVTGTMEKVQYYESYSVTLEETNGVDYAINKNALGVFTQTTSNGLKRIGLELNMVTEPNHKKAFYSDSYIGIYTNASEFGTATADKVLEGYTFTGSDGFKKIGTYVDSEPSVEVCEITASNKTVDFKNTNGTVKIYGYAKGASSGWTSTNYAFNGLTYQTISTYGGGATNDLNVSIDTGEVVGLPNITSGTLLVVLER